jgi:hypothetical protein
VRVSLVLLRNRKEEMRFRSLMPLEEKSKSWKRVYNLNLSRKKLFSHHKMLKQNPKTRNRYHHLKKHRHLKKQKQK